MVSCSKRVYSNPAVAHLALRALMRSKHGEVGIYRCGSGHGFHLTSNPNSAHNKWTRLGLRQ